MIKPKCEIPGRKDKPTEHTPKWRLRSLTDGTYAVYGEGEYDRIFPIFSKKPDANAKLIVRAPEMQEQITAQQADIDRLRKVIQDAALRLMDGGYCGAIKDDLFAALKPESETK